ncbi:TrmH family RNA methyltransferase [Lentiprolixibacter aurantiacus]|uniref:tRNA (guanosine(18)-2'-O)-methyltransferase n=1 Tax=Lentiprolixibacter aurantiacus TaxID=2993939 RepID=A0AAE3SP10_9FLAO|nr:RNA methyltransferase [Lentiprolixibacter aurantiacus]MCX2720209.1 RNA methyltransferase [Lentiprolixibacter aurantiacus]
MSDQELLKYLETLITPERRQRFIDILELRTRYITVAVEDVFQMHNSSAVIRSCEVFGIQDSHLIEARFGKRLDKNIALGAQQWVDNYSYTDSPSCIQELRQRGYRIVATTPHCESCLLDDYEIQEPIALFFGTEKEGLSKLVLDEADDFIKIPMVGFTESLNISVAAAIVLQNLTSKLRSSELPWKLTEEEKFVKRLDWTKKSIKHVEEIIDRYQRSF